MDNKELLDALKSALACILGAEALGSYRPDPPAVLSLLDGVECYVKQARAALAPAAAVEVKP